MFTSLAGLSTGEAHQVKYVAVICHVFPVRVRAGMFVIDDADCPTVPCRLSVVSLFPP
jgi:hypothetical protein